MEVAALIAVARFRSVRMGYYLYAGDDVSGDRWRHRRWTTADSRGTLLDLALRAVLRLERVAPPAER